MGTEQRWSTPFLKSMQILDALSAGQTLGASELARALDLPKSSVFAILETLASRKVVEKNAQSGKYLSASSLSSWATAPRPVSIFVASPRPFSRGSIFDSTKPSISPSSTTTKCSTSTGIESKRRLRTYSVIGVRAPLYCTSVGKAILAFRSDAEIDASWSERASLPLPPIPSRPGSGSSRKWRGSAPRATPSTTWSTRSTCVASRPYLRRPRRSLRRDQPLGARGTQYPRAYQRNGALCRRGCPRNIAQARMEGARRRRRG